MTIRNFKAALLVTWTFAVIALAFQNCGAPSSSFRSTKTVTNTVASTGTNTTGLTSPTGSTELTPTTTTDNPGGQGFDGKPLVHDMVAGICPDSTKVDMIIKVADSGEARVVRENCMDLTVAQQRSVMVTYAPQGGAYIIVGETYLRAMTPPAATPPVVSPLIAQLRASYSPPGLRFGCDDLNPQGATGASVAGISWISEVNPTFGVTRGELFGIAQAMGYTGAFGDGSHTTWLTQNGLEQQYAARVNAYATPGRVAAIATARSSSYQGVFICGNYDCWKQGRCDMYGRAR